MSWVSTTIEPETKMVSKTAQSCLEMKYFKFQKTVLRLTDEQGFLGIIIRDFILP